MLQAILAQTDKSFWLPRGTSTISGGIDSLFNVIMWLCIFFFLLVTVLLVWFVIRYRHRPGVARDTAAGHSTALEITWTVIPSIIVVFLYYYGFREYMNMTIEPPNSYEITATGQMWQWSFSYPNGYSDPELHVPAGVPVRVVLQSNDVIHSLYLPAFRVKKDVVPGRFNRLWFQATTPEGETETSDIYCAAYCGTNHSLMRSHVIVHRTQADFDSWMARATEASNKLPPVELGHKLYSTKGCAQCHTIDASKLVGPSWKDMWGRTETMSDGKQLVVDEPYVIESIRAPQAKIVQGFPPSMPPFPPEQLKDNEVKALIAYMKSISSHTSQADLAGSTTAPASRPAGAPTTQK